MTPIRVVLLHSHDLFRDVLRAALDDDPGVEVVAVTGSPWVAERLISAIRPAAAIVEVPGNHSAAPLLESASSSGRLGGLAVLGVDLASGSIAVSAGDRAYEDIDDLPRVLRRAVAAEVAI